jgi:hypothetical protein
MAIGLCEHMNSSGNLAHGFLPGVNDGDFNFIIEFGTADCGGKSDAASSQLVISIVIPHQ